MGDPRKIRKKYEAPTHPWQKDRIEEEKQFSKEYGLKNKKEIWRMETILKKFKNQVKSLASRVDEQSKLEEKQLVNHLTSYGLMSEGAPLDSVLGLGLKDVLERRLQTVLVRKGLARSMKQARQFITHGHVIVDKKKITFPSYIVNLKEEAFIEFVPASTLSKEDHPERMVKETAKERLERKKMKKKEEVAPPTFAPDEIEEIEEKGAVEKKKAEDKKKAESKSEAKKKEETKKEAKKEEKKEEKGEKIEKGKKKEEKDEEIKKKK